MTGYSYRDWVNGSPPALNATNLQDMEDNISSNRWHRLITSGNPHKVKLTELDDVSSYYANSGLKYDATSQTWVASRFGINNLSELNIDTDKDWANHSITNLNSIHSNSIYTDNIHKDDGLFITIHDSLLPNNTNEIDIGSSEKYFYNGYISSLYTSHLLSSSDFIELKSDLIPDIGGEYNIGSNSKKLASVYTLKLNGNDIGNLAYLNIVGTDEIEDNAITSPKISSQAVTEEKIANNSVSTIKIKDNAVSSQQLAETINSDDFQ